jgi:hypothetical protein
VPIADRQLADRPDRVRITGVAFGLSRVRPATGDATLLSPVSRKPERLIMEVVVIGGTELLGSKLVNKLTELGHEAIVTPGRARTHRMAAEWDLSSGDFNREGTTI